MVTPGAALFYAYGFSTMPSEYASGTVTGPGGVTFSIGNTYQYEGGEYLPTRAAIDAKYAMGSYTVSSAPPQTKRRQSFTMEITTRLKSLRSRTHRC